MGTETLIINKNSICSLLGSVGLDSLMDLLIERLTSAIRSFDPQTGQIPPRSGVAYELPTWGLLEWMPAHTREDGTTVKLVGYHPSNPRLHQLPTVLSTICVFDGSTGHLDGLVDGTFLTALRTGAASAVASRILADPGSRNLGVIGCGAQAVTQIHALSRVFDLEKVTAFDTDLSAARTLEKRLRRHASVDVEVEVVAEANLGQLLSSSDILVTCTSEAPGNGPVFPDFDHKPHLHINAVGSDFPEKTEVPLSLLRRSLVCPDFMAQALAEGDSQQLAEGDLGPDFIELLQEENKYREARSRLTVFDSTGWAFEDLVAAKLMLELASERGIGERMALECVPSDPKDPYSFLDEEQSVIFQSQEVLLGTVSTPV